MNFIFPRSYLAGLTLSAAGGTGTFGIAAGQCTDDANTVIMNAGSAFTKTTATFAEGTGNGALLDVGNIVDSTWYHAFAMERLDTLAVDYGVSSSLTPTLPTNYTTSRRIGSMLTDGSGHWTAFTQIGDLVIWANTPIDLNSSIVTSATLIRMSVPPDVKTTAVFNAFINSSAASLARFYSPDGAAGEYCLGVDGAGYAAGQFFISTNVDGQIYWIASGTATVSIETTGYIDRRGRDN